jgi:hypothetical protein
MPKDLMWRRILKNFGFLGGSKQSLNKALIDRVLAAGASDPAAVY